MFPNHHPQRRLYIFQDLGAEFKLFGLAKLGQVTAVKNKIGLRIQVIDILYCA
jgi:hypothetical protein